MKLEIEEKMIKPVIEAHIATAIIDQLGDPEEVIQTMVRLALNRKVDSEGKISNYSSDNRHTFIEIVAGKAIREAAKDAIMALVAEQKPLITRAVEDELRNSPEKTAAAIVSAFALNTQSNYHFKANFTISKDSD